MKGDEKSEAQIFLLHLLEAFSNDANTLPEGSTLSVVSVSPAKKRNTPISFGRAAR